MLKKFKKNKKIKKISQILRNSPQKKGLCILYYTTSPKKPNSAVRKVAKVKIISTKIEVIVGVPGQQTNDSLQKFSNVLIRGGRLNDVPGVKYKVIRGKLDFGWAETFKRSNRRSKYSVPKPKLNNKNV